MQLKFTWDKKKAASNYKKHGVHFETACKVFDDFFTIGWMDERENYGEERFITIGMVNGILLTVVWTESDNCIRIISARKAMPNEENDYFRQNKK
jgi:uncharacterized DUF497 family protein